jgi:uroporphyrinogen-III synthase
MRLLVTRPKADAVELQAHLLARGHEVRLAPLLEVSFSDCDPIELDGVQALIATSKNGVRALAQDAAFDAARGLALFAVGPGTAAAARALGFEAVIQGPRSARELVPMIAEHTDVNAGSLLHLAGDTLAFDIAGELGSLGFHVLAPVVYVTRPATELPKPVLEDLREGNLDGVLLLSPQTARVWVRLVDTHSLSRPARFLPHICLSQAVADALRPLGSVPRVVAAEPNLDEMLAAVERAATNWSKGNVS